MAAATPLAAADNVKERRVKGAKRVVTPRWVIEKLEARAAEVASAELGSGSNRPASSALYRASYALGQLVPHLIDRPSVTSRLLQAAAACRMRASDAERTIDKGIDEGMRNPWHPTKTTTRTTASMTAKRMRMNAGEKERRPPNPDEVMALWSACTSVLDDTEVCAWLRARKIDPVRVDADNLALALPKDAQELPRWAKSKMGDAWASWAESGHRLVLPLVDVAGNLRSVLARDITEHHREKKSLSPLGHARAGFFMRDSAARVALWPDRVHEPAAGLTGGRWYDDAPERRIVIVEGEKKYLQHATLASDAAQHAPATIGIFSGSWTDALAALIPDGWVVRLALDPDGSAEGKSPSGGLLYATKIIRSLEQRHRAGLVRVRWGQELALGYDTRGRIVFRLAQPTERARG